MKTYIYLILLAFISFGCSNDDDNGNPNNCDFDTVISDEEYANAPSDALSINNLTIEGDCLNIEFSTSGCDGSTWVVSLIDSESVFESDPPQRNLRLSLEDLELCLAIVTKELSFDISRLQVEGDSVLLNIVNSDESILYNY